MRQSTGTAATAPVGLPPLRARQVAPSFAAEITGMPVHGDVPDALFDAFLSLFRQYRVAIVPGLSLAPGDLVAFSKRFGELEIHARIEATLPQHREVFCVGNVERDGMKASFSRGIEQWHCDSSYREVPSAASLFYGEIVPPEGGDTFFADATAAYADLDDETKARIDGLRCIHALETLYEWGARHNPERAKATTARRTSFPPVSQPLVRVHPVTGEKSLFLCPAVIREVEGMDPAEGRALIDGLVAYASQPKYVYRHVWSPGDLVIWDNRAVLHTASLFDHTRYQRLMYRTTVAGRA